MVKGMEDLSMYAKAKIGASAGAIGAVAANGSETTDKQIILGGIGGAAGANSNTLGAAVPLATAIKEISDSKRATRIKEER